MAAGGNQSWWANSKPVAGEGFFIVGYLLDLDVAGCRGNSWINPCKYGEGDEGKEDEGERRYQEEHKEAGEVAREEKDREKECDDEEEEYDGDDHVHSARVSNETAGHGRCWEGAQRRPRARWRWEEET